MRRGFFLGRGGFRFPFDQTQLLGGFLLGAFLRLGLGLGLGSGLLPFLLLSLEFLGHEFDEGNGSVVPPPVTELHYSGVAAGTLHVSFGEFREKLLHHLPVSHVPQGLSPGVKTAVFAQGYELFHHPSYLLGPGVRGVYPAVAQKVRGHVSEHGLSVLGGNSQFSTGYSVSHAFVPSGGRVTAAVARPPCVLSFPARKSRRP